MNNTESLYVAWQAPDTRDWHVVGNLKHQDSNYIFNYTEGAKSSEKFTPFSGMDDLTEIYISKELFPLFKNRLLSPKRPEYSKFISWLGLNNDEEKPLEILARSGGVRSTDQLQLFKKLEVDQSGKIIHYFFVHALSHLSVAADERVTHLQKGDLLKLCPDSQNSYHKSAVIIRADNPPEIVGYCPRYFSDDIQKILIHDPDSIKVTVHQISSDAPKSYRLLCKIEGQLDPRFKDLNSNYEFQSLQKIKY